MIFYSRTGHWYSGKQISLKSWKCFCKAILLWQHLWKTTVFAKSIRNKGKNDQPKLLKITYSREINQLCAAHRPALDLWIYSFVSNSSKLKACLGLKSLLTSTPWLVWAAPELVVRARAAQPVSHNPFLVLMSTKSFKIKQFQGIRTNCRVLMSTKSFKIVQFQAFRKKSRVLMSTKSFKIYKILTTNTFVNLINSSFV